MSPRWLQTETRLPQLLVIAIIFLPVAYFVFPLLDTQTRNLKAIQRHIEKIDGQWTQFTDENPQYHELKIYGYTGGNGMFGVAGMVNSEEDKSSIVEFLQATNPPRPIHANVLLVRPWKDSEQGEPELIVEELELSEYHIPESQTETAKWYGVPVEDLLTCDLNFTLDGASHHWIYRFDDTGQFSYAILLRCSEYDKHPSRRNLRPQLAGGHRQVKVFRETIKGDMLFRAELNAEEIHTELGKVEDELIAFLGADSYHFYYEGGMFDETEDVDESEGDDPFAPAPPMTADQLREEAYRANRGTASYIAKLIKQVRTRWPK